MPELCQEEIPTIDGYIVSSKGNYISEEVSNFYFLMVKGKVPDEWVAAFHGANQMGNKAKNSSQFCPI